MGFADLKKHAESLGPSCGPANLDLCDADKKKQIEDISKLSTEERETKIKEQESQLEKAEKEFKEFVEGLQKSYQEASDKKGKDVEAFKPALAFLSLCTRSRRDRNPSFRKLLWLV